MSNYKIINYENKEGVNVKVRFDEENNTIWLTQSEIAVVLNLSKDNVKQIIKRIHDLNSGGDNLSPTETTTELISSDGKTYKTKLYNIEMIEAISLRSKSTSGYDFIKWAREKLFHIDSESLPELLVNKANNYEIATFTNGDFSLDVSVSPYEKTIWLTQNQLCILFECSQSTLSYHINNIFNEKELDKISVYRKIRYTGKDNKTYSYDCYNFNVVIYLGFRINNERGKEFRKWATRIIESYSIRGYAINPTRATLDLNNYTDLIVSVNQMYKMIDSDRLEYRQEFKETKTLLNEHNDMLIKHDEILKELTDNENIFKGMILYEGDFYTGYSFAKQLMLKAKERIILVDGYMELSVLDMLNDVDKNIPITIYTFPSARLTNKEIAKFSETHNLTYIRCNILHGRFLAIDNELYLFDGSIKDIGEKRTVVVKIDFITIEEIINKNTK